MDNLTDRELFGATIPEAVEHLTYPDRPGVRKGSPDTAHEAAEAMAPKIGRLQRMALHAIREAGPVLADGTRGGLTADEVAERLNSDRWSIQPRTSELKAKGLIADSKARRRNVTGKRAVVWVAAEYAPKVEGVDNGAR